MGGREAGALLRKYFPFAQIILKPSMHCQIILGTSLKVHFCFTDVSERACWREVSDPSLPKYLLLVVVRKYTIFCCHSPPPLSSSFSLPHYLCFSTAFYYNCLCLFHCLLSLLHLLSLSLFPCYFHCILSLLSLSLSPSFSLIADQLSLSLSLSLLLSSRLCFQCLCRTICLFRCVSSLCYSFPYAVSHRCFNCPCHSLITFMFSVSFIVCIHCFSGLCRSVLCTCLSRF